MPSIKKRVSKAAIINFLFINLGMFLVAMGTAYFRNPNKFALGGINGVSILMGKYFPNLPIGSIMLVLNIVVLGAGFVFLGRKTASKSVYSSFALSGMVWILEIILPMNAPFTNQRLLELIYAVFLPGIGSAIVFHYGSTTGGTDILAKILSKYFKIKVSIALLITDFIIAFAAGLIFGVESGLFSALGVFLKTFVLDSVMETMNVRKIVVIVSAESGKIKAFICDVLKRDATVHEARGAYTNAEKEVITSVMNRKQALFLQNYIKQIDPHAFITVSNSSSVLGLGFETFE